MCVMYIEVCVYVCKSEREVGGSRDYTACPHIPKF